MKNNREALYFSQNKNSVIAKKLLPAWIPESSELRSRRRCCMAQKIIKIRHGEAA
ncbi:hypothetical protein [Rickettsia endosymbiont of Ceutorhynchus obstrictus]|uniref:hypothetical protein n=1 Tax=Rickettsia endosymbiont of Ceutorhynchus obstrictus TaxID=3066249 RepID=UPI003133055C